MHPYTDLKPQPTCIQWRQANTENTIDWSTTHSIFLSPQPATLKALCTLPREGLKKERHLKIFFFSCSPLPQGCLCWHFMFDGCSVHLTLGNLIKRLRLAKRICYIRREKWKAEKRNPYLVPEKEIRLTELKLFNVELLHERKSHHIEARENPTPPCKWEKNGKRVRLCQQYRCTFSVHLMSIPDGSFQVISESWLSHIQDGCVRLSIWGFKQWA